MDGHWDAALVTGAMVGIRLQVGGRIGAGLIHSGQFKEGISLSLGADGMLTRTDVYDLASKADALHTIQAGAIDYWAWR